MKRLFVTIALLGGCGTPARPVGLPPPEYETPRVEPWPPPRAPVPSGIGGSPAAVVELPAGSSSAAPAVDPPPPTMGGTGATLPAGTP